MHPSSQSHAPFSRDGSGTTMSRASRSSSAPQRYSFSRDSQPSRMYGRGVKVSPAVPHSPPSPKTPTFTPPLSCHLAWTSHHPPSPTPILQLDGDTPEPDKPRLDLRNGPDLCGSDSSLNFILSLELNPSPKLELNLSLQWNLSLELSTDVCSSDVCRN